ncbi:hypothetical protein [Desulfobacca acetoxidans]
MVVICLALSFFSCSRKIPEIERTVFAPGVVAIELDRPVALYSVEVMSGERARVARALFSKGYWNKSVRIDFNWTEKCRYRIRLVTGAGNIECAVVSPELPREELFIFHFPFGMKSQRTVVPADTEITGSLQVKNDAFTPRRFEVQVSFSEGFRMVDCSDMRYRTTASGTVEFRDCMELSNHYDSRIISIRVMSPNPSVVNSGVVTLRILEAQRVVFQQAVRVRVLAPEFLSHGIQATGIDFPTDDKGDRDERLIRDVLNLTPIPLLLALFTGQENDDVDHRMVPFSFYNVTLENTLREDVALILRAWVEDPNTGEKLEAFRPHFHVVAAGEIFSSVIVSSGSTQKVIVPIYVEPFLVLPGTYRLRYTLTQFGTCVPFSSYTHDFQVAQPPIGPIVVTTAGAFLTVIFLPTFLVFFKRIYGGYKVRWIILAALYGAVGFVVVSIPGMFFADLFRALLEPFSFLATGFFYGVVQYTLWGSLIVLVPRKGMMTLVMAVRLLLSGVMLGNISAVSLIGMSVHAFLTEVFLWITGCTRGGEGTGINAAALLLAFVLSDVISTFFSFKSAIFLYRLYYADWYIVLNCLIGGVVYTFVGTMLGLNMGKRLKMVVE